MPLDLQVAALYANRSAGVNPGEGFTVEQARAQADRVFNDRQKEPAVNRALDRTISCEWGELPVRIYLPEEKENLPVLLYFHGGGFVIHNIASHDSLCRNLALASGAAVVSVGYRLAPENPLPAAIEDGYSALLWVWNHADSFSGDPGRIAVCGDSAGAHISAAVSILSRDRSGPAISAQVLCYGEFGCLPDSCSESVRLFGKGEYVLPDGMRAWFARQCLPEGREHTAYRYPGEAEDLGGMPETLLITAEYDPLRDDGEAFAARLEESGNSVELWRVPGLMHGFLLQWRHLDRAMEVIARIGNFLRKAFAAEK